MIVCVALILGYSRITEAQVLRVFAAASLKEALDGVTDAFQRETGIRATAVYAASSALARQIEGGAPADVFLSADETWMNHLSVRRLIDAATRFDLLGNRLVLVAPAASTPARALLAGELPAALGTGRLAIADPAHVPAGRYARAALEKLGLWNALEGRLARTENIRIALALAARGEVPFAVVYWTDALAEPRVRVIEEFALGMHPPIVYPVALVAGVARDPGMRFIGFLRSAAARAVFERRGFTVLAR